MRRFLAALLAALSMLQFAAPVRADTKPPKGWRFPVESDYKGEWQENRARVPVPFHVLADFDGDRVPDDAWILIRASGKGWGLFVFLNGRRGRARAVQLENHPGADDSQDFGIALARPGDYKTACGKGYTGTCEPGVPEVLRLKRPGIDSFYWEKTNSIYYWDGRTRRFKHVLISD
jgi:hypothetical protein